MFDLIKFFLKNMVVAVLLLSSATLFGYDYSSVPESLSQSIKLNGVDQEQVRIALVFEVIEKERVQKSYNVVDLKRDLANELIKYYEVADPFIIAQILKINQVTYAKLYSDRRLMQKIGEKSEATHLVFAHFEFQQNQLLLDLQLFNLEGEKKGHVQLVIPEESVTTVMSAEPVRKNSFFNSYSPPPINRQFNESWVFFAPTAFFSSDTHLFEFTIWPKSLKNTDLRIIQGRYDYTIKKLFSFGVLSFANDEKTYHSHYAYSKLKVVELPKMDIALGLKKRLAWNEDNKDFKSDNKSIDDKNLRYNNLTLQGMVSGWYEEMGTLWSAYIDNQNFSFGVKFLFTPELKFVLDSIVRYYENAHDYNDHMAGIQINTSYGGITTISYQTNKQRMQFSLGFSW